MLVPIALLVLQNFITPLISAARLDQFQVGATQYVYGYFSEQAHIPKPTSPPKAVHRLLKRDPATCGYYISDGSANICSTNQYCTTSASGNGGVWNCCNPNSCALSDTCVGDVDW
ncbi:hypothetical protein AOQ84DRAFT_356347 [Glonium stellatum]|uniref:Uncharacterized protein n=1 Tax=Glonium stellatum TaxID=574774 RepID=A0A8E2ETG2_9PEZI|nr:hypothetical protein AOQ84DRAFT_356347 [Glonium stellatum]